MSQCELSCALLLSDGSVAFYSCTLWIGKGAVTWHEH